jgi:hypothetical protein
MKNLFVLIVLAVSLPASAQLSTVNGWCEQGAQSAVVSGMNSTNKLQGIIPGCTVTPYLTGTTTLATYYLSLTGSPQTGPFTADTNTGQYLFYAANGICLDVYRSSGTTDTGVTPNTGGGVSQIVPGTNVTISSTGPSGTGIVTINSTPSGTSPLTTKGDLYGYGTTNARIPVGTDGYVLTADSTQAVGLKWAAGGGSMTYPAANTIGVSNSGATAWRSPLYSDITALFGSGSCSGYLKSDGTCSTPSGGVSSINGVPGAFTFSGSDVSCSTTTCTFTGSGSVIGSIAWAIPSWLTASPPTISASGTQTFTPTTGQTSHQVIGTCGTGTSFVPCSLVAADLPTIPSTQVSGLGTFATQNYATPPAIGGTTPAAGTFTTLSAKNLSSIGPRYDVTQYGAVGNGSTDDTAAIQAAFNACWNNGSGAYGGIVQFPGNKSYAISSTINAWDGCRIDGSGGSKSGGWQSAALSWIGADSHTAYSITGFTVGSNTSSPVASAAFPLGGREAGSIGTFTATNSLAAGQWLDIEGCSTTAGAGLNRAIVQVVSSTGSAFVAVIPENLNHTNSYGTFTDTCTATTVNVAVAFDGNARYQQNVADLGLGVGTGGDYDIGFLFGSRTDTSSVLNVSVDAADMYSYYFVDGGINTQIGQGWRSDHVGISGIYWRGGGSFDNFSVEDGTSANDGKAGGFVTLDNAICVGSITSLTVNNMLVELDAPLTAGQGAITMYDCPTNDPAIQFNIGAVGLHVVASGDANNAEFSMIPASDYALTVNMAESSVSFSNTQWVIGIPAMARGNMNGNLSNSGSGYVPFYTYSPSTQSNNGSIYDEAPIQLFGDVNISQLWQDGVKASDFLYSDTGFAAMPNGTTLYAGQIIAPPAYWSGANGKRYAVDVVYQAGTTGTPNSGATTCTGTAATSLLTCTSATDLSVGQRISIGTDTGKEIFGINALNPSSVLVQLTTNLSSTYSTATALNFSAPVLGPEIQMPTKSSAAPTTLAWSQGDMEQNSGATANGVAAWVNVAAGTPGTWAGVPLGNSSGQIAASQISNTVGSGSVMLGSAVTGSGGTYVEQTSPTITTPTTIGCVQHNSSVAGAYEQICSVPVSVAVHSGTNSQPVTVTFTIGSYPQNSASCSAVLTSSGNEYERITYNLIGNLTAENLNITQTGYSGLNAQDFFLTTATISSSSVFTFSIVNNDATYPKIGSLALDCLSTTSNEIASVVAGTAVNSTASGAPMWAVSGTTIMSTVATGTAPLSVTSTTPVPNLSIGGTASNVTGTVALTNGGTGATTAAGALANLGGAPLASPTFTGTVTIPSGASISGYAKTICSGTLSLGTSPIASGAAATTVTGTCTGLATTDVIGWGFNGDPTSTLGYEPATTGMLTIISYPTSGNVNFKVVNNTASSITPGAITLNFCVHR